MQPHVQLPLDTNATVVSETCVLSEPLPAASCIRWHAHEQTAALHDTTLTGEAFTSKLGLFPAVLIIPAHL